MLTMFLNSKLLFFYCTIPLFLSAFGMHRTFQLWRNPANTSPSFMIRFAVSGLALWLVQFFLNGPCIWVSASKSNAFCPFAASGHVPTSSWSSALKLAWAVPFVGLGAIML